MFDLDLEKILVIIIVAVVVIGPKDLPRALRAAGRWIGKARRVSNHFRAGVENMIREAELEEMEKKWAAQNAAIMGAHPALGHAGDTAAAPAQPLPPHAPGGEENAQTGASGAAAEPLASASEPAPAIASEASHSPPVSPLRPE